MVDSVTGAATLDRFAEAARQAALADTLVISKTDLAPFGREFGARLDRLNARARGSSRAQAEDPGAMLFDAGGRRRRRPCG